MIYYTLDRKLKIESKQYNDLLYTRQKTKDLATNNTMIYYTLDRKLKIESKQYNDLLYTRQKTKD